MIVNFYGCQYLDLPPSQCRIIFLDRIPWVVFSPQQCHILTQFSLRNTLEVLERVEVEVVGCSVLESWAVDPLGLSLTLMCLKALQGVLSSWAGLKPHFFRI